MPHLPTGRRTMHGIIGMACIISGILGRGDGILLPYPLWFAVGALGAFAVALTGGSMEQQLAGFVAVSFLTLILIRPVAFLMGRHVKDGQKS